jgi:hypothetical protein
MLPSLCRLMASNPSMSCPWGPPGGGTGAGNDADLASVPLAGSIGTRFVARLYSEGPLR